MTQARERLRIDVQQERSWFGGPLESPLTGAVWEGRSLKRCSRECACEGFFHGTYIPLCPFRRHAVSGKERGELEAERRGYAIPRGSFAEEGHFGAHLPRHPEDTL